MDILLLRGVVRKNAPSSSNEPLIDHLILDVEVNSEDLPIFPMS